MLINQDLFQSDVVKSDAVKNDAVKKDVYNAKIKNGEDKIPVITNLATNASLKECLIDKPETFSPKFCLYISKRHKSLPIPQTFLWPLFIVKNNFQKYQFS